MSRIHDALRKAEEERLFERGPESAITRANGILETADLLAVTETIEEEVFPAGTPQLTSLPANDQPPSILSTNGNGHAQSTKFDAPKIIEKVAEVSHSLKDTATHGLTPDCIEQFRTLRTRLNQVRSLRPLKRLLVSSALPGEGKTFMAARLAQILAQQKDCRVLLIDGDLRCGSLHQQMEVTVQPGITEFLKGTHDEQSVIYKSARDGVYVMPCGERVAQSAELLASGQLKMLMDRLANSFDWIVVDSPAATIVSDACILAEACDGVVLIIEAGATPFDLAQKAKLSFEHTPVVGAVLNRAVRNHKSYYDYYQRPLEAAPAT